ncbi:hypothetical protein AGRO_2773 [Agrobacterium sp. ATCC 31749]|nr:hypothetical protein AGRO_2773 [Agrobacterium sp. ATCC 31749]
MPRRGWIRIVMIAAMISVDFRNRQAGMHGAETCANIRK